MTTLTTPAEAYDATQQKMVRIPQQFPDSPIPLLIAGEISNVSGTNIYDAPRSRHSLSLSTPLAASTTLKLALDNFHPQSGLCHIRVSASAAVPKLTLTLSDTSTVDLALAATDDLIITAVLIQQTDGSLGIALASITNLTATA